MIALVPTREWAERNALPGGEPAALLHCTLAVRVDETSAPGAEGGQGNLLVAEADVDLSGAEHVGGDVEDAGGVLGGDPAAPFAGMGDLVQRLAVFADARGPVHADGFAADMFNPATDRSCVVLGLTGEALAQFREELAMVAGVPDEGFQPWIPHITLQYTDDISILQDVAARTGPIVFDRLRIQNGPDMIDFPLGGIAPITAAVNASGWEKLPIADRDTTFAFRAATDRLAAKASSVTEFSSWFFWRDPTKPSNNRNSYRMPFADVFDDGTVKLVPAAVFSAAAQLSGAHGALPIIPDAEKEQIRDIIGRIYDRLRDDWNDPRVTPPWTRDSTSGPAAGEVTVTAAMEEVPMPITLVDDPDTLTAAAPPVKAPAAWFEDPQLPRPTRLRVEEDGRVYGHVAAWNSCHRGIGNACILPPRSASGYAQFRTGTTLTADGILRKVGHLTYGGPHADLTASAADAVGHYADAGTSYAYVNAGEDAWGIWVAGVMAPGTGELEAQQLRAHPLSGDWRRIDGSLELVAALAVNTPGYPVPEPQYALTASGEQTVLVAAGIVEEDFDPDTLTADVDTITEEPDTRRQRIEALEAEAAKLAAADAAKRAAAIINIYL